MRRCLRLLLGVLHVALLSAAYALAPLMPAARAQPGTAPTFSLNWVRAEGAEGCASSQQLARAIEQLLGPVLRTPSEAQLAIEGSVTQTRKGVFEMRTRVMTPQGEVLGARTLERAADDCAALTPAILLVLTLTLDPDAAAHGYPTELLARIASSEDPAAALLAELNAAPAKAKQAEPVNIAPVKVAVSTPPPAPVPAAKRAEATFEAALQAGPAMALALLPSVSAGANLVVQLSTPWPLALLLGGAYWAPSSIDLNTSSGPKQARFSAAHGQLSACIPVLPKSSWQLLTCVGGVIGLRWVDASALANETHAKRLYGGPSVQLSLRYALSERWFAALDVSAALLPRRDTFTYADIKGEDQALFEPSLASGWSSLGVGVRL